MASFIVFAAVVAVLVASKRPTLRPMPILLLGVYLALLGFIGVGGARNPVIGWFSTIWVVLGALGLVLVVRTDQTTRSPEM